MEVPRFALRAGPRRTIYYQPASTRMAIVCSGGICPGENDVVRALALDYGVREGNILGIRLGWRGFYSKTHKPIMLTRQAVEDIHLEGGTVLGTCEAGECNVMEVVKRLDLWAIDMLFVIGNRHDIDSAGVVQRMCDQCSVQCAVIALPKSIDNDVLMLDKCFGYETCVEEAQKALLAAKVEASSAYRGIGLVKLMGRHSGFIAVKQAALASGLVDVVLIPEAGYCRMTAPCLCCAALCCALQVPFNMDKVLNYMGRILDTRGHVVVCLAEGAGQVGTRGRAAGPRPQDPATCHETDSGSWMKGEIKKALKDVDAKYIDPSYLIRSIPATSDDRVYCKMLAHGAVHAAFAGYTNVAVGQVNTHVVYLPLHLLVQAPRQMDPQGELWNRMCAANGQPPFEGVADGPPRRALE
ncbi:hypothetical protein CHLNCDRAFT_29590 [Chlorella variabilis]|uniref:Phosphofructokinase domain-containing protein n=1 Tax=Chlorella variabilis TaxID=554065 RepID=E1Z566_CHLVA|nr:hypothetical protein CHLNCDRAFT_29590 [Chlorella variabilis]EFN59177.1 hypothetical protein CHLNCDRAFT_29590 [Chlorella variabilis]|eukprot:XP_005851279.1 hypothetical protein CHLNCDRAFT_29590 [Chlorella variabilis]